jgi:hypothetical protein
MKSQVSQKKRDNFMGEIFTVAVLSIVAGSGLMYVGYLSTRQAGEDQTASTTKAKAVVNSKAKRRNQEDMAGYTSAQGGENVGEFSYTNSGVGNKRYSTQKQIQAAGVLGD